MYYCNHLERPPPYPWLRNICTTPYRVKTLARVLCGRKNTIDRMRGGALAKKSICNYTQCCFTIVYKICLELCTMLVLAHLVPGKTLSHPSTRRASQANLLQATANVAIILTVFLHCALHYFTLAFVQSQVECLKSFTVFKFWPPQCKSILLSEKHSPDPLHH